MKIVIAGAGAVGMHLARWLSSESHDITLIDRDQERLVNVDNSIDALTVVGEVTDFKVLKKARVASADLFISVTSVEEANILACIQAKKFGARRTIARISRMQYLNECETLDIKSLGIDELISPESLASREVRHLINTNAASESIEFENGKITLLGLDIDEEAQVCNKSIAQIADMYPARNYIVVAIRRGDKTIIPKGETIVQANDHLFVITDADGIEEVLEVAGKRKIKVENIMIMGGSRTGRHLARKLGKNYHVKLIEVNPEKSREIAADFPDTLVLNFDGTDVEKLEEEGIKNIDVFVAVTGNSETNILSCLVAKDHGAKKTIAMVENIEYQNLSHSIGIDSLINKKLAAANFIYRHIRRGDFLILSAIHGVDAEVMEFEVSDRSKILEGEIKNLGLPEDALIGGVIRNNKGLIPTGDFQILPGDKVVVFAKNNCAKKMTRYFR
ncbi:MAG: Trk system potassium transporter TrkA [Owenweeksia sp.]|nr:Trk system potassium transporter TrkA [Owenweeksia sp.]HBF19670.1 Trk system potassium transporter TrkA [Cryomorphaceae bacterium]|tara:strand:+ start:332 stop:1672 length:1341 start_codon:yes stop_codon:yes gene_type:complete